MDSFLAFISSLAPLVNCVLVRETLFLLSVLLLQASSAVLAYSQELPFLCLSWYVLICLSILKNSLAGNSNVGWQLFPFWAWNVTIPDFFWLLELLTRHLILFWCFCLCLWLVFFLSVFKICLVFFLRLIVLNLCVCVCVCGCICLGCVSCVGQKKASDTLELGNKQLGITMM